MKIVIQFLFLICFISSAMAKEPKITPEQLAQQLEIAKKEIVDKEVHQRKIMSSLYEINRKMKKIVKDESSLNQQRMAYESSAKELAVKVLSLEEKLKAQKSLMRERLSAIYKLGGQGLARLIFSASSSAELEKNLKILGIIAKRDLDVIKEYSSTVKELESKKVKFTQRLAKIKKLSGAIKNQEQRLANENNGKSKILDGIRQSKQFSINRLSGLRTQTNQLAAQDDSGVLDLLFRPSFFEKRKNLPAPVSGLVVKPFGIIRDEEHNLSWSHKGVLFSVPMSTPVKTVFAGKVAFVGEVSGHGKTVIVDHGDHYYTVYGNNKDIAVKLGDELHQSQVIAHSGRSTEYGDAEGTESLYFEIRHFSEPYDPQVWLKGTL